MHQKQKKVSNITSQKKKKKKRIKHYEMKKLLRKQSSAVMCVEGAPFLASHSPLTDKNFTCHGQSLSGWNDVHLDLRISLPQALIQTKKKKERGKKKRMAKRENA